jgi:RsiW-degrading membrane proteinase PrsW (M82 family)
MTGAVALTLILQMAAGALLLFGVAGGIALADPELLEGAGLRNLLDEIAEDPSGGSLEGLVNTPTVAFGLMAMIAVIAPLSEELTKAFGATLVVRGHAFTLFNAFLGGAMGGLGFALVENVGYVMADPTTWPQLMLLRAPVAIIHVAAAALVAVGWFLQRTRGGFALLWFYLAAVIVHGGWNALFGALLLVSSGALDGEDPSVAASLLSLVLVGAMGALLLGTFSWVFMNARRLAAAVPAGRVTVGAGHTALALPSTS